MTASFSALTALALPPPLLPPEPIVVEDDGLAQGLLLPKTSAPAAAAGGWARELCSAAGTAVDALLGEEDPVAAFERGDGSRIKRARRAVAVVRGRARKKARWRSLCVSA